MKKVTSPILAAILATTFIGADLFASVIPEVEPNNSLAGAQLIDGLFNLDSDPNIKDSTVLPHVSIQGAGEAATGLPTPYDYYRFTVTTANSQAIFDVDDAYKPGLPGSNNPTIALWDAAGNPLIEEDDTWGDCSVDPGGSACFKPAGQTERLLDPFLQYTFSTPGQYIVGIAESAAKSDPVVGGWYYVNAFLGDIANPLDPSDTYTLHISLQNAIVPEPAATMLLTLGGLMMLRSRS